MDYDPMKPFITNTQIFARVSTSKPPTIEHSSGVGENEIQAVELCKLLSPKGTAIVLAGMATVAIGVKLCRKAHQFLKLRKEKASEKATGSTIPQNSSVPPPVDDSSSHQGVSINVDIHRDHSPARYATPEIVPAVNQTTNPPRLEECSETNGDLSKVAEENERRRDSERGCTVVTEIAVIEICPMLPPNKPEKDTPSPPKQQCPPTAVPSSVIPPAPQSKDIERKNPFETFVCPPKTVKVGTGKFQFGEHRVESMGKKIEPVSKSGLVDETVLKPPGVQTPLGAARSEGRFVKTERSVTERESRRSSFRPRPRRPRQNLSIENTEARARIAEVSQTGNFRRERRPQRRPRRVDTRIPEPPEPEIEDFLFPTVEETRELQHMGTEDV